MPDLVDAPAVVERLLQLAVERGASDLHLDPCEHGVRVRLRRDGVLQTIETLPSELGQHLVGRCKALAELLVYRRDLPQEGRITAERSGQGCEFRVATYPTLFGERVALRLDARQGSPRVLSQLGLEPEIADAVQHAISQPEGVVLLTGPSGSGKTTTLYSCLHHLVQNGPERTIVTVEDPVERRIEGIVQTEVDPAAGLGFARALRSLLRQDPDVLLVGEIRDRETAAIALEAGLTGHLVASTLHARSAAEVFARLLEMCVEPFVLTTTVRGVLAQRLLRKLCPACNARHSAPCDHCQGAGYVGRQLVAEWLPMSPELRKAILARGDGDALTAAADKSGFPTLRSNAEKMTERSITTQEEVDRVLGQR